MRLTRLIYLLAFSCIFLASTSFAGDYHMIDTEFGQLEYVEFTGNNDGAIILLPGNPSEKKWQNLIIDKTSKFYEVAEQLNKDTGRTVIAVARPGFGNSFGRAAGSNITVESCKNKHVDASVEGIKNIIVKAGLTNVVILGHSAGSRIGATYALRHPEDLKRVVLYDGSYNADVWQRLKGKSKKIQTHAEKDLEKVDTPSTVEYILMYGEKSGQARDKVAIRFHEKLIAKNFNSTLISVAGAKHMDFIFSEKLYAEYLGQITK